MSENVGKEGISHTEGEKRKMGKYSNGRSSPLTVFFWLIRVSACVHVASRHASGAVTVNPFSDQIVLSLIGISSTSPSASAELQLTSNETGGAIILRVSLISNNASWVPLSRFFCVFFGRG